MKRAIVLFLIPVACIVGFLSVRGAMPFIPVYGSSMEPALHSGGLLIVESIEPWDIKTGDIITYKVPELVREYYNYPTTVAHRVIEIKTEPSLGFRTQGDNAGEDPFTIQPQDIKGTVGTQIPYIGIPLLFFQSIHGLVFCIIAFIILVILFYRNELSQYGSRLHRGIFSPVINEEKHVSRLLSRKIGSTEERISSTELVLDKFANAIGEYARHLSSHTSAIQDLAEASKELKKSASEQNRVLVTLMQNMEKITPVESSPVSEITTPQTENAPVQDGQKPDEATPTLRNTRYRELHRNPEQSKEIPPGNHEVPPLIIHRQPSPLDYEKNQQARYEDSINAENEILSTLDRLHVQLKKSKN